MMLLCYSAPVHQRSSETAMKFYDVATVPRCSTISVSQCYSTGELRPHPTVSPLATRASVINNGASAKFN